ncbi:unnamed protein product [Gongylonema pulchrum]|uniref:POP1 domain-containing protein n=1 Tax=Gongylonema pulchrum TaxID=637853 RepID=A0A183D3A7_9BILA|nr:unnamed protein product [Gongylonema pulchrum]
MYFKLAIADFNRLARTRPTARPWHNSFQWLHEHKAERLQPLFQQHHRGSRAKRNKRAMRSGANAVVNHRTKRYQMLAAVEANTRTRAHPTITARQNQVCLSLEKQLFKLVFMHFCILCKSKVFLANGRDICKA